MVTDVDGANDLAWIDVGGLWHGVGGQNDRQTRFGGADNSILFSGQGWGRCGGAYRRAGRQKRQHQ